MFKKKISFHIKMFTCKRGHIQRYKKIMKRITHFLNRKKVRHVNIIA